MWDHALPYSVSCSLLFADRPMIERPRRAAEHGFDAIEMWWPFATADPSNAEVEELVDAIQDSGVHLVAMNFFAGDMGAGERGVTSWPGRQSEWRDSVDVAVHIAGVLGTRHFNALYGNRIQTLDAQHQDELALEALALACDAVAPFGGTVMIEPVSRVPTYPIRTAADAVAVIDRLEAATGRTNLGLLADIYHMAVNGDNLDQLAAHVGAIAHVQIADVPGRGEPGSGSLDLASQVRALESAGYSGYVGLEFSPTQGVEQSLSWLPRERRQSA
jgi:hydroxypyruvate isomerase